MNSITALRPAGMPALTWYADPKMVALVHRTSAKDCNADEFNQFIAVARDLNLNPLRKQIYAFVFSKDKPDKRNMVIVVAIDGMRAISARGGLYRPDNRAPRWMIDEKAIDPLTNPLGIVCCEVSIFTGHKLKDANGAERIEWNEVVGVAYWTEFAPIKKGWQDDRDPEAAPKPARLDPSKDGWIKSGRHMIAKCAEAIAHRKANPEPLSLVYTEEETHRGQVIDGEYTDLTPAEMVSRADAETRLERIGGPALFATFDDSGTLERVPHGQFADRVLAHTEKLAPAAVALFVERNKAGLQEFWAYNKTDALELRRVLETRSGAVAVRAAGDEGSRASAAAPQHGETDMGAAARPAAGRNLPKLTGLLAERHRDNLIRQIGQLETSSDLLYFGKDADEEIARLPSDMAEKVRFEFNARQRTVLGS